ncbi:MAG: cytochrome c biogenesis protein ResB [Actinomycetota bacterium]
MSAAETLSRSITAVWRNLRSMRTALILLLVLGLATVAGSLIPQAEVSPQRVAELVRNQPLLGRIADSLGLFDVFGSWWFTLVYVLVMISLASCLIPRSRGFVRNLRRERPRVGDLEGMRHFVRSRVGRSPEAVLEDARNLLRRRRFRVTAENGVLAGEKGLLRDVGSLLFHGSFFLLLAGVVIGKGFGLSGQATVIEGETWVEAHANYDFPPQEGRFFSEGMHRGFQIKVLDFDVSFHQNGVPREFVSAVEVRGPSGSPRREEIRVNDPLRIEGVNVYQAGYGWAPVIEVRRGNDILARGPIVFVTDEASDPRFPWRGVVKLPSLQPQIGIEFRLLPDAVAFIRGAPMLEARNPFLTYRVYRGDLGLTRAQKIFRFDKAGLAQLDSGGVGLGQSAELPDGLELSFFELRRYTQFQLRRDPGIWIVLAAAVLVLAGLLPALYSSRQRIYVRAAAEPTGARIEVAGFALQRKAAFEDEFRALTGELLSTRVGGRS